MSLSILAMTAAGLTSPCFVDGLSSRVECGSLAVPVHHDAADGPTIDMAFVRLPARSATPAADPVVVIPGGPGQSGRSIVPIAARLLDAANVDRNVIVIVPRCEIGEGRLSLGVGVLFGLLHFRHHDRVG